MPRDPFMANAWVPSAALNTWMRLLSRESPTAILLPSGDQAILPGLEMSAAPVPLVPNAKSRVPSAALNTWMRPSTCLDVTILVPSGEYAASCGR